MRRSLVVGNWKMHGSLASARDLLSGLKAGVKLAEQADMAVCPPYVHLPLVAEVLAGTGINWGSQNVSEQQEGAYTGEVAPAMLAELDCRFAIVGHSERRSLYGESDQLVANKFVATKAAGLIPILCVGESLEQRESGETLAVIEKQLQAVADIAGDQAFVEAVIAYEPVWAIGTGKTATPEQAQEVHAFIRELVAQHSPENAEGLSILYGGSVKAENAAELFAKEDIDGALVGGASLKAADFAAIYSAAAQ